LDPDHRRLLSTRHAYPAAGGPRDRSPGGLAAGEAGAGLLPLLPHPKCAEPDAHLSALSPRPRGPALAAYWQAHEAEGTLGQRQGAGHLVSLTYEGHTSSSQGLQG